MKRAGSRWPRMFLGLLPVSGYIALIVILHIALPYNVAASLVFDPPALMLVLNTVFLFGISFAVSVIATRAYVASGSSNIFLLGCGVLGLGTAALAGGWVRPLGGEANTSVTIHNLGVLVSAVLHGMSAILTLLKVEPAQALEGRRRKLFLSFGITLLLMVLIIAAALLGVVPLTFTGSMETTKPALLYHLLFLTLLRLSILPWPGGLLSNRLPPDRGVSMSSNPCMYPSCQSPRQPEINKMK